MDRGSTARSRRRPGSSGCRRNGSGGGGRGPPGGCPLPRRRPPGPPRGSRRGHGGAAVAESALEGRPGRRAPRTGRGHPCRRPGSRGAMPPPRPGRAFPAIPHSVGGPSGPDQDRDGRWTGRRRRHSRACAGSGGSRCRRGPRCPRTAPPRPSWSVPVWGATACGRPAGSGSGRHRQHCRTLCDSGSASLRMPPGVSPRSARRVPRA